MKECKRANSLLAKLGHVPVQDPGMNIAAPSNRHERRLVAKYLKKNPDEAERVRIFKESQQ